MKKKGLAFFFIICSHALDVAFGQLFYDKPFFQSIFLFAYILGEFCSIIENVISMGYADALPSWLGKIVRSLEPRLANAVDKQLDHVGLNNEEENKEKFP